MDIKELLKQTNKLTILYVEDSDTTRDSTSIVLHDIFKITYIATDGQNGLELYTQYQNEIDFILTDIQMPNMDGFEMIKRIRKISTDIPIFIFSAYDSSSYLFDAINLNVSGYILKPFELEQFTKSLQVTVENIYLKKNLEETIQKQIKIIRNQDQILEYQSRLAAMGEMIDAIAHQWKNPLSQISVYSSTMLYQNDSKLFHLTKEQIKEYGEAILAQTNHMTETLNTFRDFFRPKKNLTQIYLCDVIKNALSLVQDQLLKHNIKVNINCDSAILIELIENEFKHVFINLVSNSKDAFVEKNIHKREIYIDVYKKIDNIVIKFCDNAGGISKKFIDRVFIPNVTTKKTNGTGIGLYLTKQIVEKHSGEIKVNNENHGACFTILLKRPQIPHE
jgi:signal transduction histidine kinase